MPAPIAKGLIVLSSILIAAGYAAYQDPVIQRWVDSQRRRIAMALHSLGDEIDLSPRQSHDSDPPVSTPTQEDVEQRKRRRTEELVRRNRNELIRKAREEGVAVDLDELAKIGKETEGQAIQRLRKARDDSDRSDKSKSFDTLVGSDGTLRAETTSVEPATVSGAEQGLRGRGAAARAMARGAASANPFADEHVLLDHDSETTRPNAGNPPLNDEGRIELPFLPEGSMSQEDYEMQLKLLEKLDRKTSQSAATEKEAVQQKAEHASEPGSPLVTLEVSPKPTSQFAALPGASQSFQEQLRILDHKDYSSQLVPSEWRDELSAREREERDEERAGSSMSEGRVHESSDNSTIPGPVQEMAKHSMACLLPVPPAPPILTTNSTSPSVTASFHSANSAPSTVSSPAQSVHSFIPDDVENEIPTPTGSGAMTPVEVELDEEFDTAASIADTNASDIGDVDLLSEMGVESLRSGALTPSSFGGSDWTDLDSDVGMSEDEQHLPVYQLSQQQ